MPDFGEVVAAVLEEIDVTEGTFEWEARQNTRVAAEMYKAAIVERLRYIWQDQDPL